MNGSGFRCENCGGTENSVVTKKEMLPVRGEDIEIESNVRVCICGNEIFDEILEDENLTKAYDEYRKRHHLLSPQDIRGIRGKYNLSQRTLGKILGWGEITFHRYETGAIPDSFHHKILKLLEDPNVMRNLLIEAQDSIPRSTFKQAMEKINSVLEEKEDDDFFYLLRKKTEYPSVDVESGYKQFDLEKFTNVVLYFAQNISQLWKTKFNKLLFYLDFNFFKEFTVSLTGLKYVRFEHGPVPKDYDGLLWGLEKSGFISITPAESGAYSGNLVLPLAEYDPDVFSKMEINILEQVKEKYGHYSSTEIRDLSHKEKGWLETSFGNVIPYYYADFLN